MSATADDSTEELKVDRTGGLVRSIESLNLTVSRLKAENHELQLQLMTLRTGNVSERAARRAALNLLEDAEESRQQLEQLNIQLDERVRERTKELLEREERLQLLAAQLTRVEQQERQRLSQILHDHVQQMLVAAKMRVELASIEVAEAGVREQLEAVVYVLNDSIEATRTLSVQLTPPLLHDQGLPAALDWLASRMAVQHGLLIHPHLDPAANPAVGEHRDILFQAAQELLLNVAKHAGLRAAMLNLRFTGGQFRLEVTDRGLGFDTATTPLQRGSFGLLHLRHRLEAIGGRLLIQSSPGAGTAALAVIPKESSDCPDREPDTT